MEIQDVYPIRVGFTIPVAAGKSVERFVYAYVVTGEKIALIDTGVAGAQKRILSVLRQAGKEFSDVSMIVLTHAHPDHIGAAAWIRKACGAEIRAHANERAWIEDTALQARQRPVPGFSDLVAGPVDVDRLLAEGDILDFGEGLAFRVMHTPGHSPGSISLYSENNGILFSGDAIPQPGGMPIYDDVAALENSLVRLAGLENLQALYSSWQDPLYGQDATDAIAAGMAYVKRVHQAVTEIDAGSGNPDPMAFCRQCVQALGLPPFAANPLVLRSFLAHKQAAARYGRNGLFADFRC